MIFKLFRSLFLFFKIFFISLYTLPRDLYGLRLRLKIDKLTRKWEKEEITVAKQFLKLTKKHPNKAAIIFEKQVWTYQDIEDYSNKVAHVFASKYKLRKGDSVAIFMENRPEYVAIWLGLSKLGVIGALINTNLKQQALVHSITIAKAKVVVYGAELAEPLMQVHDQLDAHVEYVIQGNTGTVTTKHPSLEALIKPASTEYFVSDEQLTINDTILYIYTSGTTGLPKPAIIKNNRYFGAGYSFLEFSQLTADDIVYIALPIYHGNGGMIGIGTSLVRGNTCVLRKKFSASNFWKDCIEHNCTVFIYVGEICRYLVNQPPSPLDRKHPVKLAIGNGMRANVWKEFTARFGVRAFEFYAASEGNCITFNFLGKIGACGFLPPWNRYLKIIPMFIIKIDEQENPIRDANGFCICTKPGEKGLVVGIIGDRPINQYNGYANNKEASSKKIIENLFKKGQRAFNSGDLMMTDEYGWFYFCDRLGDTYRWKGENVSTVEVENIISSKLHSAETVVYGVQIPGQEGRAGMAAIIIDNLNMDKLTADIKESIPTYARPLFIRVTNELDHTGTFRAQKHKILEVGYNITKTSDKIYYFEQKTQTYSLLTKEVYQEILDGKLKV